MRRTGTGRQTEARNQPGTGSAGWHRHGKPVVRVPVRTARTDQHPFGDAGPFGVKRTEIIRPGPSVSGRRHRPSPDEPAGRARRPPYVPKNWAAATCTPYDQVG
ncbi:hypothetical protein GCM10012284_32380 [Mangrovihabitans endophyticus]|uniref:Uncharacterized protein n=1 Tax=Mangrovihabitans endophyticus TaxID=1751298 RepID=A0A8J3C146_9ACTN|nr:hypothetical protein GCM10012284_32380 [Mangrovihabitans endophyticus]